MNLVQLTAAAIETSAGAPQADGDDVRYHVDDVAAQLSDTLSHAGAQLVDYLERGDGYRVTYKIGNRSYTSSVNKGDLTVQVAGICLSGEDDKFDLGSLVGVLHESRGDVPTVGDDTGMTEEQYWRYHPRRRR